MKDVYKIIVLFIGIWFGNYIACHHNGILGAILLIGIIGYVVLDEEEEPHD